MKEVEWLLNSEPRAVQLEALRRSYYGYSLWDQNPEIHPDASNNYRQTRDGPAKGWGHFLQMRLGKTPTFLNEFSLFRRDYDYTWSVVLTPPKFKLDWKLEAERFNCDFPTHSYRSTQHEEAQRFIDRNAKTGGLIAINYEALRYEKNRDIIGALIGPNCLLGADESVLIKNPESMYTKEALKLSKNAGAIRALTGKPVLHSAYDYWSQLRFLGQIDGTNQYAWRYKFCTMGGFKGRQIKHDVKTQKNADELFTILDECSWAPRRIDWMRTFSTDYVERYMPLSDELMRMYTQMQNDFLVKLADGRLVSADQIVGKLLKMQQISSGFLYDEFHKVNWLVPPEKNTKVQAIKEILENEIPDGEKVILFTCFTPTTGLLRDALAEYNPAGKWAGISDEDFIAEKQRFNNDPHCRVFIGNTRGIKYGNTLIGTPENPCLTGIFVENWYSLDDRAQGEERPQGASQTGDLTIFDLICTPHDRAPIRALQRKEDVSAFLMRYDRSTGLLPPRPEPLSKSTRQSD